MDEEFGVYLLESLGSLIEEGWACSRFSYGISRVICCFVLRLNVGFGMKKLPRGAVSSQMSQLYSM